MIETGYKDNTTADCVEERPNGSERRAEVANSEGKKQRFEKPVKTWRTPRTA